MDNISNIQTQTISKFKNPVFCVYFMADNNPKGVLSYLEKKGYKFTGNTSYDKPTAKKIILEWYNNKETSKISELLNSVSYMNEGDSETMSYTKGFRDYFIENTPTQSVTTEVRENISGREGDFSWDGLFAGLGAGLTTYTSFNGSGTTGTSYDQAMIEAEKKKTQTRTWIIIGSIVGLIALTGIVILVMKKKKDN